MVLSPHVGNFFDGGEEWDDGNDNCIEEDGNDNEDNNIDHSSEVIEPSVLENEVDIGDIAQLSNMAEDLDDTTNQSQPSEIIGNENIHRSKIP